MLSNRRVQSTAPCSSDRVTTDRRGQNVGDAVALLVDDVHDARAAERADVVRLSARRGIERRFGEIHAEAVLAAADDVAT